VFDPYLAVVVSNPKSDKIVGKVVSNHNLTASIISEHPRMVFFWGCHLQVLEIRERNMTANSSSGVDGGKGIGIWSFGSVWSF